jgi:hypothetical protein
MSAGRVAQWKSTRLTSGGSLVRTQPCPPETRNGAVRDDDGPNPVAEAELARIRATCVFTVVSDTVVLGERR